jgi:hypothetical protein
MRSGLRVSLLFASWRHKDAWLDDDVQLATILYLKLTTSKLSRIDFL